MNENTESLPGTQADYAYEQIRRYITSGVLKAGDRLLQAELAEDLKISVTPVREALRRLEQDGLAKSQPHRGTTVIGLDLSRAEEIYAMRTQIEPLLIKKNFGSVTEKDLAKAKILCDKMHETEDIFAFSDLNQKFHKLVINYDNSWTARVVKLLAGAAAPYVSFSLRLEPSQIKDSNMNHYAQIQAVREKDLSKLIKLEIEHLNSTLTILKQIGDELPS